MIRSSSKIILCQGLGILFSFLYLRMINQQLNIEEFAFWLTLITIVNWMQIMDFGVCNTLRNKLTEIQDFKSKRYQQLLTSAYSHFNVISVLCLVSISLFCYVVDFPGVIGYEKINNNVLSPMILLFSGVVSFRYSFINSVFYSLNKPELVAFKQMIVQTFFLISVVALNVLQLGSLILIAVCYLASTLSANMLFFNYVKKTIKYKPRHSRYKRKLMKKMKFDNGKFFILQLSGLIFYSTDMVLISKLLGGESAASYNIGNKIFNFVIIAQGAYMGPLWTKYTSEFRDKNYNNILSLYKKSIILSLFLCFTQSIVYFYSETLIELWLGSNKLFSREIFLSLTILTIVRVLSSNFSTFLNSRSMLNTQVSCSIFAMVINIPLSIYFVKIFNFGAEGVAIATILSLIPFLVLGFLRVRKELKGLCL
ncbi:oligosaccharide flippase family protein [Vibrio parahaemolyticus]|nr:oligosaccharide flippase family protein [Vibrio parahaemolyticus]